VEEKPAGAAELTITPAAAGSVDPPVFTTAVDISGVCVAKGA
jgi:hypothetical protein